MISDCLSVNEKGHLTIGGADTVELAAAYGTPLYVMDETAVRSACRSYKRSIDEFYGGNGLPLYASKTFACKEIYRIMDE
ncbi:MAG: diaminopimelate decarboxylase, partial [Clostridiales bacterium]|nr:diaminopimelate decarboxylase [Clostridiales bacterium]